MIVNSMLFNVVVLTALWTISISGEEITACLPGTISVNVTTNDDMHRLTDAMNCTGQGVFNVTLYSSVQVNRRIEVSNQKRVHITVSGFPTIRAEPRDNELLSAFPDAGTTSGIFLVSNQSTLSINALVLEGGYAEDGGGVAVLASSSLHAFACTFKNNSAAAGGESRVGRRTKQPTKAMNVNITTP